MEWIRNFPFFAILLAMVSGPVSSVLPGRHARRVSFLVVITSGLLSVCTLAYVLYTGEAFTYQMGAFPAPFGNEIRAGVLEAMTATFFCLIMLLSLVGGYRFTAVDIAEDRENLFYILINLLLASLLALIYTNDLFTGYVFIEINTIAACGLIMIRGWGRNLLAATKYMIMSLLGSGLLLISIAVLYGITGHLLMEPMHGAIVDIVEKGTYTEPLTVAVGLFCVGIAIKSALFPFHSWLPDAYGYSTCSSSAILSSLVSKGYIFLLIKIYWRVIGIDIVERMPIRNILLVLGIAGMVIGSVQALHADNINRMAAFSSAANIGYIFMGIGIGGVAGYTAAIFHIFAHAVTKAMLFLTTPRLAEVSGDSLLFKELQGSGLRDRDAGVFFTISAFSMIGIPIFAGFAAKLQFGLAAVEDSGISRAGSQFDAERAVFCADDYPDLQPSE